MAILVLTDNALTSHFVSYEISPQVLFMDFLPCKEGKVAP